MSARARGPLLSRVVATHLLVAILPALVLGLLVVRINRDALTAESQNVHLAVAARLRDALTADVRERAGVLAQAERVLDMDEVPIERRKELLRALVAGTGLGHLALHGPDGKLDSLVRPTEGVVLLIPDLDEAVRREATERGWAAGPAAFGKDAAGKVTPSITVVTPWKREGQLFGWISSELELAPLTDLAERLRDQYLGPEGRVDVVDGSRRYLASSERALLGGTAETSTPFGDMSLTNTKGGLAAIETGISSPYVAPDGSDHLGTVVSVPALRWFVGTSRPEGVALASLRVVTSRVLLMALIAALLASMVGLALARHITDPLQRLTAGVRKVAGSGFRARVEDGPGTIELAELRGAFNEVLRQLDEHRALARYTMQVRLRLSRFLSPTALHRVLTSEQRIASSGREEEVTVLYAEVTAPPASASSVPREHLVALLGEYYVSTCRVVEQHGGRVDHYSGDAVIGIFGASWDVHHAESALRAARGALVDALRVSMERAATGELRLGISVALATGRGVIGQALDEPGEVSVVGDLVDRAAAIQHAAAPGTILVDDATRLALGPEAHGEVVEEPKSELTEKTYRADVTRGLTR